MPAVQLKTLLAPWLLPPFSLLLLALFGLLLALRWRRTGLSVTVLALLGAIALNLPIVANQLAGWVEAPYVGLDAAGQRLPTERLERARGRPGASPQAIVVLGGGTRDDGPDRPGLSRLNAASLERVLQGRRVARATGLPLLVSGGSPDGKSPPEADVMARVLSQDLGQPVRWLETGSRDTIENARHAYRILKGQGIDRIILVTNAMHMRRAETIFRDVGFQVIPVAHDFVSGPLRFGPLVFVPTAEAFDASRAAFREMFGLGWLWLRARLGLN